VVASDLAAVLPLLKKNVSANVSERVAAAIDVATVDVTKFDAADIDARVDVVVGADVIYDYDITDGIVDAIVKLAARTPFKPLTLLFSVEKRYIFSTKNMDTEVPVLS
jgi:predicted nicotinamide N-methyase